MPFNYSLFKLDKFNLNKLHLAPKYYLYIPLIKAISSLDMPLPTQNHYPLASYRPDIDGLRAIAVLAVVIYHAFPKILKGGFIGVDVFFVISGYLISTILFESLSKGIFSFVDFYFRRIRRIFPALIIVLFSCFIFGWFVLTAEEYRQLGKHIAAGAGFISNFIFWNEVGYFNNAVDTKPLLHLWSLGIEEQFYIIWPLLLWMTWKGKFNLLGLILLVGAASFFLSVKGVNNDVVATFYSPQTRFWELLSGSLLAWIAHDGGKIDGAIGLYFKKNPAVFLFYEKLQGNKKLIGNIFPIIGLALLAYGFWRINHELKFPGKWALVPVLGCIFIIASGPSAWISRTLLSNKPIVFIGLISFPLYLWHWPLLSFARIIEGETPMWHIRLAIVGISILLAWLTYRLIERPIRFGGQRKFSVLVPIILLLVIGFVGYNSYERDGLPFRSNATLKGFNGDIGHLEFHRYIAQHYFRCTPEVVAKDALMFEGFIRCMQSKENSNVDIALLGDSHIEHLFHGLAAALPSQNIVFYIKDGPPFIHNPDYQNIYKIISESNTITAVIIGMYWYGREITSIPIGSSLGKELIKLVDALSGNGRKIYLIDDIPKFPFMPEVCKGKRSLSNKMPTCSMPRDEANRQKRAYISDLMQVIKDRPNVKLISVSDYLCNDNSCNMTIGKNILYRDHNHLNLIGSKYIGGRIVDDNPSVFKSQ